MVTHSSFSQSQVIAFFFEVMTTPNNVREMLRDPNTIFVLLFT